MEKRPFRKEIKYTLLYYFVRFLIFSANLLPRKLWLRFCGMLGQVAYHFSKKPRELAIFHLGLVYSGEKSIAEIVVLAKKMFEMLGKNAGDILRSLKVKSLSDLQKFLTTHGFEHFQAAHAKGKGVIFLTCHVGAFDMQSTNMAFHGVKLSVVGTPMKDERLNTLLQNYRNAFGASYIERGKDNIKLIKELKLGNALAILIDQDTKVKSRIVNFFGMPAATPIGATILAMKTGAAVVPCFIHLDEKLDQHMHIYPEIPLVNTGDEEADLVTNTQKFNDFIEMAVRQHPDQWVWMHERWKTKAGEEIR